MHPSTIDLMRNQARAIYHALTGTDLPEEVAETAESAVPVDEVARRFVDLEAMARRIPNVTERTSVFTFAPLLDVCERGQDLVVEVAVPGVDRDDVTIEATGETLVVSGISRRREGNGSSYLHAELPAGPFFRVVKLPYRVDPDASMELDRGLVTIRLRRSAQAQTD